MNKNKFLNILFFSLNGANIIFVGLNFIYKFLDLYYVLALFLFLNSIYLLAKYIAYASDSSLFFGIMFLFGGFFLFLKTFLGLSFLELGALLLLDFSVACLFIFIFFKSIYFCYLFLSNFLIFFPIFFYSFNIIELKLFFIFVSVCVIINVILYLVLIKSVKRA
mgnify:CR=1 FL=1